MKFFLFFILSLLSLSLLSQNNDIDILKKGFVVENRVITIDSISISPYYFKLINNKGKLINKEDYTINFSKAKITFNSDLYNGKTISVNYKALPEFLTKTYTVFDENLIVTNTNSDNKKFYQLKSPKSSKAASVFEGLETSGHLARGITMGNNQDGVVNSGFELQLKGKLSRKVSINATISDNKVPLQDNGYSQRLNEYDKVFVEIFSDKWKIKGGDLFLKSTNSRYTNFNKKVAGLSVDVNLGEEKNKIDIFTSGSIVKGKFTEVKFKGQEANQGPYRLSNNTNQLLLIISDSETVYVNGLPLEKKNYKIDYSAAEISFNTSYPIDSDMRIIVEFQSSDENYTRFVSFNKVNYQKDKFNVEVDFYSESDSKSKNLQQDLDDTKIETLSNAGDNENNMYVLSAIKEVFKENKIQYKKENNNGTEMFTYSNDDSEQLYSVKFTYTGNNQGNYKISNTIATGRIYEFVSPINGIKQGDYEPKIQLIAPNKLQITTLKTKFNNSSTLIDVELAYSNNDKNLFSSVDDADNFGFAGVLHWEQLLLNKKWKLNSNVSYEVINKDFVTIENIEKVEFERNWNIDKVFSNQKMLKTSLVYKNDSLGYVNYQFENLDLKNHFNGSKHSLNSTILINKTQFDMQTSLMQSKSIMEDSKYSQIKGGLKHRLSKFTIGLALDNESNHRTDNILKKLNKLSYNTQSYSTYIRLIDSIKSKLEVGYSFKVNDSIVSSDLEEVSRSNNYYLKSTLVKNKKSQLMIFANYRYFTNSYFKNDKSLISKIDYSQQLANGFIKFNTIYESSSGTIPQQEFNYVEVDTGKGYYTWIDYNSDGIQDLDEFEIAKFQDEATYVRVLLPSTKFIRTNQTKFSNLLTINPSVWNDESVLKNIAKHFINQTNISIDNKQLKKAEFQLNPFDLKNSLSLQYNLKNYLFYNRGKQHYSFTYMYLKSENKTVFVTGLQENNIETNKIQFTHKINHSWVIDIQGSDSNSLSNNERYVSRNMDLNIKVINSKLVYLFNDSKSSINISYNLKNKENKSIFNETLKSNNVGAGFQHLGVKNITLNSSFNYISNAYNANQNSPIAYQLLEGLQNGENYTWNLVLQKRITNYLSVNVNYNGRKSETINTIHTGTIQLKANF